jgi:hypothetical protein
MNNINFHKPHIRSSLRSSGAIESYQNAVARTAILTIETSALELLIPYLQDIINHPDKYASGDVLEYARYTFDDFCMELSIPNRAIHQDKINLAEKLMREA